MYDLLIKGGMVIDPARGLNAALDVAVTAGRIARLDKSIPVSEAKDVIDASGNIVSPGLIDLHAHVYRQGHSIDADELCGVGAGVTSIIDAGNAGAPDFSDFLETVIRPSHSRIYSFLYNHWWPDGTEPEEALHKDRDIEVEGIIELAEAHPNIVKGVKVAVMPPITRKYGVVGLTDLWSRLAWSNRLEIAKG